MQTGYEPLLERWVNVRLIDTTTADRIRDFEKERADGQGLRWPVLIALAFGALMICGGVLLFVAAHWDALSPAQRFSLVLFMVAAFHAAGAALSEKFPALSTALHGVGTVALGAGIFLSGQIFNLEEHWPGGIMLWALGAWIGWWLKRDWVQAALAALLTPSWLVGEWAVRTEMYGNADRIAAAGVLMLAFSYLTAVGASERKSHVRTALLWIGGIALIPAAGITVGNAWQVSRGYAFYRVGALPLWVTLLGWALAIILPLRVACVLRGRAAWMNVVAALWTVLLAYSYFSVHGGDSAFAYMWNKVSVYLICAIGAVGLAAWGLKEERKERINLGVVGFGITVLAFYFSEVMDKLGRSASLIGFGLIFLILAWGMERTRRKLIAHMSGGAQ
jgi:uncharacterized membrane protein